MSRNHPSQDWRRCNITTIIKAGSAPLPLHLFSRYSPSPPLLLPSFFPYTSPSIPFLPFLLLLLPPPKFACFHSSSFPLAHFPFPLCLFRLPPPTFLFPYPSLPLSRRVRDSVRKKMLSKNKRAPKSLITPDLRDTLTTRYATKGWRSSSIVFKYFQPLCHKTHSLFFLRRYLAHTIERRKRKKIEP